MSFQDSLNKHWARKDETFVKTSEAYSVFRLLWGPQRHFKLNMRIKRNIFFLIILLRTVYQRLLIFIEKHNQVHVACIWVCSTHNTQYRWNQNRSSFIAGKSGDRKQQIHSHLGEPCDQWTSWFNFHVIRNSSLSFNLLFILLLLKQAV